MIDKTHFSKDVLEFLQLLYKERVKYLIVGGEAVIYYGHARVTGDIDIFYEREPDNTKKLFKTLEQFWGGHVPELDSFEELMKVGVIVQFGVPPNRIDLINEIDGVSFKEAWEKRVVEEISCDKETIEIYIISLEHLIKNKKASGRPRDIDDLNFLLKKLSKNSL